MNAQLILAVAAGGAVGSVARLLVGFASTRVFGLAFPWGTLIVNIAGSFLIGALVESFALRWNLPQAGQAFLTIGICGGFTTFSTFSLDAYALWQRGQPGLAAVYVLASVVLSIGALLGGLYTARAI
jgi:fluoride exporter